MGARRDDLVCHAYGYSIRLITGKNLFCAIINPLRCASSPLGFNVYTGRGNAPPYTRGMYAYIHMKGVARHIHTHALYFLVFFAREEYADSLVFKFFFLPFRWGLCDVWRELEFRFWINLEAWIRRVWQVSINLLWCLNRVVYFMHSARVTFFRLSISSLIIFLFFRKADEKNYEYMQASFHLSAHQHSSINFS